MMSEFKRRVTTTKLTATLFLGMSALVAFTPVESRSQTLYWDRNGATSGAGTSPAGTWDTSTSNWNTSSAGDDAPTTWVGGGNAVFSAGNDATGTFTVTVSGSQSASSVVVQEGTITQSGGEVNIGSGTFTINSGAMWSIDSFARFSANGKVRLNGGTMRQTNPTTGSAFIPSTKALEINGSGIVNYTSSGTGLVSTYGGTITGVGGTTSNGGSGTLIKTGVNEIRYQGAGMPNSTFAKLRVNQGLFRLGFSGGVQDERGFGAVPTSLRTDAILIDGGELGASFSTVLHENRGITIGPSGGSFNSGGGGTITLVAPLSGSGTVTLMTTGGAGGGLTLNNANNIYTFSGAVVVNSGVLTLNESLNATDFSGTGGTVSIASGKVFTVGSGGTPTSYAGQVTGSGLFTKTGSGTLTLNPASLQWANTGGVNIAEGSLKFGTSAAGIQDTSNVNIAAGANLDMGTINDLFGSLSGSGDVIRTTARITLTAASGTHTFNGVIQGTGDLLKGRALPTGAGDNATQVLSGNNSFGAVTMNAGALVLNGVNTIGGNIAVNGGALRINNANTFSGTVTVNGGALELNHSLSATTFAGTGGSVSVSGGKTFTVGSSNATTGFGGAIAGAGNLSKVGTGTLTLSSPTTFTGETKISGGTIQLAHAQALQNSTFDHGNYGGTLSLGTLTNVSLGGLKGNENFVLVNDSSADVNLTLGGGDANVSYGGQLSGGGSLTKVGAGAQVLAGTNSHTGGTVINSGKLVVDGSIGGPLTLNAGGTLGGSGTINTNVTGNGRVAPGNSPGILTINGDYTQNDASALEIEVGGTTPGNASNNHDKLEVTGSAVLAGRLEVPLINGFIPQPGQEITFLTANELSGSFKSLIAPNLDGANPEVDLALEVTIDTDNDEARLTFVAPILIQLDTAATTNWSDAAAWDTNTVPGTTANTTISSTTPLELQVRPQDAAQVNRLNVTGASAPITIDVQEGSTLSATQAVIVSNQAVIELGGGDLESDRVAINSGGMLAGTGEVVGQFTLGQTNAASVALLSPGVSDEETIGSIDITGPYVQRNRGVVEIDVEGTAEGEYDTIRINGQATLNGTLRINAANFTLTTPGQPIPVFIAGSLAEGTQFADVVTIGGNDIFFAPIYEDSVELGGGSGEGGSGSSVLDMASRVSVAGYNEGDMNRNGLYDPGDVTAFALALVKPLVYNATYKVWGDMSGGSFDEAEDGILDLDDLPGFRQLMADAGVSLTGFAAAIERFQLIPEPSTALLLMFGGLCLVPSVVRRKRSR